MKIALAALACLLVPVAAHAQCDPHGNNRPVKFIAADRHAEKMLSSAELDNAGEPYGTLGTPDGVPWTWWSAAKIRAHCAKKDARGAMSEAACVVYAEHQNGFSTLLDLAQEMANLPERVDEKRATCKVPPAGALDGAKARAFWKCLGGIQLPGSFSMTMKLDRKNVTTITVRGAFLRGAPSFVLKASTMGQGCGYSAWTVEQVEPLDWPTSNSGEVSLGDVTWAP